MTNTHGGARPGSGPKPTPIQESRMHALRAQGLSLARTAARLGVGIGVVRRVIHGRGWARKPQPERRK